MIKFQAKNLIILVLLFVCASSQAQKLKAKKYPSLFWEITGNGLKKPSYLFGTMHVSSKMVFHLSDSFYHAIRNCDAVALELNPEIWQGQMFRMQKAQLNLSKFAAANLSDYINEHSFQLSKYEDNIKRALSEEPTVVNSLLYRSYQPRADFEENTYLDLYIYQTGRKMGKMAAGVEDYNETEQIMLEAYEDMAKEKSKKTIDTDGESMYMIEKKMQDAYRKGDLDLMDSLERITVTSPAFTEKFLFKRNVIQAHSIDTILKRRSLFVGVGAAHLPGERGVIELLRKKGYKLRPIFIQDRDANQKEQVDKMRVPVTFNSITSDDGMIKMQAPGELFRREEVVANDSWQYADMNNGSYYMLTRVRNHAAMMGHKEKDVLFKIDSMLYENIPGKILKKTAITKNGYQGYDIVNRTRRGDIQRYNIFVTPFEVLVFKMSGNDNYVEGKEGETFFGSIQLRENTSGNWGKFEPAQGGFSINMPHSPSEVLNKKTFDKIDRWEYEAYDKKTGDAYMVWKKSVHNFGFLEEDTFDLGLIEESFQKSELLDKQLSRKFGFFKNAPFLDMKYLMKNGQHMRVKALLKGPHYFVLAATGGNKSNTYNAFFDSFDFTDYKYKSITTFSDTSLNIEVQTAVNPDLDTSLHSWMNKASSEAFLSATEENYNYWPRNKTAIFKSDSTGEAILVSVETFAKYYHSRDSAKFWLDKLDEKGIQEDMVIKSKQHFKLSDSVAGYQLAYVDTNSSRQISGTVLLKDNKLYTFVTLGDTSNNQSPFIKKFFSSFKPLEKNSGPSVFTSKLDLFFSDLYSPDSLTKKRAQKAISNIYFGKNGVKKVSDAIDKLKFGDKDYFELKSNLITELGYIDDSCCVTSTVQKLRELYEKTADTSYFQKPILTALARLKTKESFSLLKDLLVQDPPVFEESYEYAGIFTHLADSLPLAKSFFPEILQLASVDDYKDRINALLRDLVDSGYLKAADYESYFSKVYFDAKIQLKKLQSKDERILEQQSKQDDEEQNSRNYNYDDDEESGSDIENYAVLLMPFYEKNPSIQKFFDKLLKSKDDAVQLEAIRLMLRNNHNVPDSIIQSLASKDKYRSKLLYSLEQINKSSLFPAKYKQEDVAKSLLLNDGGYDKFAAIEPAGRKSLEVKGQKGYVYFFKYKLKKDDDWQMGVSGLQPGNLKSVSSDDTFVKMTEKKLKEDEPTREQFEKQLKKLLYQKHKSSRHFFLDSEYSAMLENVGSGYGNED